MNPVNSQQSFLTPIEDLDQGILELCTRINAATFELLVLIREFDERAGWVHWGLKNCAEWLAWRCDLSMTTALEKVRVAHALKTLPVISASFADGELSYTKVRELTRVANRSNEDQLLAFALRATAVHVAERCRELRMGDVASIGTAERAYANRSLRLALQVKRLCCDSKAVVITEDDKGEPLSIGRKSRIIPRAIERVVRARDRNCCTFPGCNNKRFLHCHHVEHWSNGGETSLDNLMLLCTKHHTLVHEGGFRIDKDYRDDWFFVRPDGIAVPNVGYVSRPYENPPAGGYLSVADKRVSEPPAPVYLH